MRMTAMSEGLQLNLLGNDVGRECTSSISLLIAISSRDGPLFYRVVDVVDYQHVVLLTLLFVHVEQKLGRVPVFAIGGKGYFYHS